MSMNYTTPMSTAITGKLPAARSSIGNMQNALPFGAKLRLKASYDISTFPAHIKVILTAMKKYGLILADIGSDRYITGAPNNRWNNEELQQLSKVKASAFEVVKFH